MTEFGDRIKAWRTEKKLTQPEACARLFPATHGRSTENARAVYLSGLEGGRTVMQVASADFMNVMRTLGLSDEEQLLKLLHAGQRDIRAKARNAIVPPAAKESGTPTSAASAAKAIDETLAKIAGLAPLNIETNGVRTNGTRPARPRPQRKMIPVTPAAANTTGTAASGGLDALGLDLSLIMQKRSTVEPIRSVHHQTLSDFVRRVIVATIIIGEKEANGYGPLSEDLSYVMQKRSQSSQIRAIPTKHLGEFVQHVLVSAMKLQEVS